MSARPSKTLAFPPARFDLVVSSLAFHYVDDYAGLVKRIAGWLVPGGVLVFSTEHPIFTARLPGDGWVLDADGRRLRWAHRRLCRGRRPPGALVHSRRAQGPPHARHADQRRWSTPGSRSSGSIEPVPSDERLRTDPAARDERRRPMFVLIRARKPRDA